LVVVGNHKPVLRNVDDAARRRFNIVPFILKPSKPDPELEAKLKAEWPEILAWMVEGCLDWQQNGLIRPASVRSATEAYFSDQDLLGQWIDEECEVDPGNEYKKETSADLFEAWTAFAARAGEKPMSKRAFGEAMQRRGFEPARGTGGVREFRGVRFKRKAVF
jgi:putative DNA primase/helicase